MRPALLLLAFVVACEPPPESERGPGEGEGEGEGEDEGEPEPGGTIVVDSAACDFGRVAVGGDATCTIAIRNFGVRDLIVDDATIIDVNGAAPFFVPPVNIGTIPPGTSGAVDVQFRPVAAGEAVGVLRLSSNDVVTPAVDVALSGIGALPPLCLVRVSAVNGTEVGDGDLPTIERFDNVTLSIDSSESDGAQLTRFEWALFSVPADSNAVLTSNDAEEVAIEIDAAGDYSICAQVFDDLGVGSVNECCVTVQAINGLDLVAELTDDDGNDSLSLHISKRASDGAFCVDGAAGLVSTSCANDRACDATSCAPDWDGAVASFVDTGFGGERINGVGLVDGDYLVSVRSIGPGEGTVRLSIYGSLAAELFITAGEPGSVEDLVIVRVADGQPCSEDLTDGSVSDDCL
jgi:hypothetical protein